MKQINMFRVIKLKNQKGGYKMHCKIFKYENISTQALRKMKIYHTFINLNYTEIELQRSRTQKYCKKREKTSKLRN